MRILLGTDGSQQSEAAARMLMALHPPVGSEFVVLSVREPTHYWMTPSMPPAYRAEWRRVQREMKARTRRKAALAVEQARGILGESGIKPKTLIKEGYAADVILNTAEEIGAHLVVLGSTGLSGIEMFLLGSVSQKVMDHASCSVLVVRSAQAARTPRVSDVILATDGSKHAMIAARFLSSFELESDSRIRVVHVKEPCPRWLSGAESGQAGQGDLEDLRCQSAEVVVDRTKEQLNTKASIETAVREGNPAEEIIRAASETDAGLVVVGSRGLSRIKRFLLGSVSQRVCRYAKTSVMLVRA